MVDQVKTERTRKDLLKMWKDDQNVQDLIKHTFAEIGTTEAAKIRAVAITREVFMTPYYVVDNTIETVGNVFAHVGDFFQRLGEDGNIFMATGRLAKDLFWDIIGLGTGLIERYRLGYAKGVLRGLLRAHEAVVCTFVESILAIEDKARLQTVLEAFAGDGALDKLFERVQRIYEGKDKVKTPSLKNVTPGVPEQVGAAEAVIKATETLVDQADARIAKIADDYRLAKLKLEQEKAALALENEQLKQSNGMSELAKEVAKKLREGGSTGEFAEMLETLLESASESDKTLFAEAAFREAAKAQAAVKAAETKIEPTPISAKKSGTAAAVVMPSTPKPRGQKAGEPNNPDKEAVEKARQERLAAEDKKNKEMAPVGAGAAEGAAGEVDDLGHPAGQVG